MVDSVIRVNKKYISSNPFGRMQIRNKKTKMKNLINDDLDPSSPDDETDSESDNEADIGSNVGSDSESNDQFFED